MCRVCSWCSLCGNDLFNFVDLEISQTGFCGFLTKRIRNFCSLSEGVVQWVKVLGLYEPWNEFAWQGYRLPGPEISKFEVAGTDWTSFPRGCWGLDPVL